MIYFFEGDDLWFPDVAEAEPDGLLMVGGGLSVERLQLAYSLGIFPWFEAHGYPYWFAPDPRLVLFPENISISKSMKQVLRSGKFQITYNQDFEAVIRHCSGLPRKGQDGTWISENFIQSYIAMHHKGLAHSVEVWQDNLLVGGLYGVQVNDVFSGESMFSLVPNASKIALIWLCQSGKYRIIDCQVGTEHLQSMGAEHISRNDFMSLLQ